ncbi:phosphotransferase [Patescibacteria group bacterium]|nr:phosphotransferase [Patescibacteria group bacterium]
MANTQNYRLIYRLKEQWSPRTIKIRKAGGQTNKNWIVEHEGKKFFVRLPWDRSDMIDRKIEGKNIAQLAKNKKVAGILPHYYLYILKERNILEPKDKERFELPDGTMMAEYIPGDELNGKLLRSKRVQQELIQTLYTFHTCGVKFQNSYDVFKNEIEKYREAAEKHPIGKVLDKKTISQFRDVEREIKKTFTGGKHISTHNDLTFDNLLLGKNGRMYLVDFEYSGFNTRQGLHYDFGTLLGDNLFQRYPMTPELFEQIMALADKEYKQEFSRELIYYGALANSLVMSWWGLVRYFSVETQGEKKSLLRHILKGARSIEELHRRFK